MFGATIRAKPNGSVGTIGDIRAVNRPPRRALLSVRNDPAIGMGFSLAATGDRQKAGSRPAVGRQPPGRPTSAGRPLRILRGLIVSTHGNPATPTPTDAPCERLGPPPPRPPPDPPRVRPGRRAGRRRNAGPGRRSRKPRA